MYAIWDMTGFSGSNADLDLAKFCILDVFREYYPKRLSQVAGLRVTRPHPRLPAPRSSPARTFPLLAPRSFTAHLSSTLLHLSLCHSHPPHTKEAGRTLPCLPGT